MTGRECAIVEAYTGIVMCAGEHRKEFYKYVDEILGKPTWTHEHVLEADNIKEKSKDDFIALCRNAKWE